MQLPDEIQNAVRLGYAKHIGRRSIVAGLGGLYAGCVRKTPAFAIAFILTASVLLALYLGWLDVLDWLPTLLICEALLVPGAVKRGRPAGVLLTLIPAIAITYWLETAFYASTSDYSGYSPLLSFCVGYTALLALAIFESLLTAHPFRRWSLLIWYVAALLSGACVLEIVATFIQFADLVVTRDNISFRLNMFSKPILCATLSWLLIATVKRALTTSKRNRRMLASWCIVAPLVYAFFATNGVYFLARISLRGEGPFSLRHAAAQLGMRGSATDVATLRELLTTAHESGQVDGFEYALLWLRRTDPEHTADMAAAMLSQRPSQTFASASAGLLLENARYEVAPLLLRYALLGDWQCSEALEDIGEPRAAAAVLTNSIWIDSSVRDRLARLLGEDVGSDRMAWAGLYDRVIERTHSPLPPQIQRECDRIVICVMDVLAVDRGKTETLSKLQATGRDTGIRRQLEAIDAPDWNVTSTDDLEREVRRYVSAVDEVIQSHFERRDSRP